MMMMMAPTERDKAAHSLLLDDGRRRRRRRRLHRRLCVSMCLGVASRTSDWLTDWRMRVCKMVQLNEAVASSSTFSSPSLQLHLRATHALLVRPRRRRQCTREGEHTTTTRYITTTTEVAQARRTSRPPHSIQCTHKRRWNHFASNKIRSSPSLSLTLPLCVLICAVQEKQWLFTGVIVVVVVCIGCIVCKTEVNG